VNVDDGVGCTDDSCDEANDVVVHAPNDTLCDNGQFCDGAETCDAVSDCQAGTPPCDSATQSCNEDLDTCQDPGAFVDLDIREFEIKKKVEIEDDGDVESIKNELKVRNNGSVDLPRLATLVGIQNGTEVYRESLLVTAQPGLESEWKFPKHEPTAAGTIMWTVTIADDHPDNDTARARTRVVGHHVEIEDLTIATEAIIEARDSIDLKDIRIIAPGDVTLRAGSIVGLGELFSVGEGATLLIEMDPALLAEE
jgi:hypothetical protein